MLALASLFGFNWNSSTAPLSADSIAGEAMSSNITSRRGSAAKGNIINVKLKPGGLSRFGYHADSSLQSRHRALLRAARAEGFRPIIGRLNLIATYSKNRTPRYSRIFKADQRWLSKYYAAMKDRRSTTATRGSSSKLTMGSSPNRGAANRRVSPGVVEQLLPNKAKEVYHLTEEEEEGLDEFLEEIEEMDFMKELMDAEITASKAKKDAEDAEAASEMDAEVAASKEKKDAEDASEEEEDAEDASEEEGDE